MRHIAYAILVTTMVTAVLGQDLGERKNIGASGFYAYTEAGGNIFQIYLYRI